MISDDCLLLPCFPHIAIAGANREENELHRNIGPYCHGKVDIILCILAICTGNLYVIGLPYYIEPQLRFTQ